MGEEGFSSDSSLLYHRGVPSAIVDSQVWYLPDLSTTPNHPLKPRHLKLHDLASAGGRASASEAPAGGRAVSASQAPAGGRAASASERSVETTSDAVTDRRLVLGNADVRISYVVASGASPLYRNAIGDECVYVESGSGIVESVFGVLSYRQGDYVLIPRATSHRWVPAEASRLYAIEASSHITPPKRYLSRFGQSLEHAPYCERDLVGPGEPQLVHGNDVEVLVKHRGNGPNGIVGTRMTYATPPFDVVGWDGCLYAYT